MLFRNYSSDGSQRDGEVLEHLCSDRFLALNSYDIKSYFPELIQKYFSPNLITFSAIPDKTFGEKRDQNEEELIESRIKTLGSTALQELQNDLDTAISKIAANLPPSELIQSFNVPSTINMPYAISRNIPGETNVCYPVVVHKVGCTEYVTVIFLFCFALNFVIFRPKYSST